MFRTYLYSILLISCLAFTACSDEDSKVHEPEPDDIKGLTHPVRISTRASSGSDVSQVGLYMVYGDMLKNGNYVNNMSLVNDGTGEWTPERTIYWKDKETTATFIGYAPYNSSISDAFSYEFCVQTDQSSYQAMQSSDFLWGKISAQEPIDTIVDFLLKHILSFVEVKVVAGNGFSDNELQDSDLNVVLNGFSTTAVINLFDGSFSDFSSVAAITPYCYGNLQYSAIIIPQTVEGTGVVTVSWNGSDYILSRGLTFASGKHYTLTVTLNKTQGGINVGIGDWEDAGEDFGGTVN